MRAKQNLFRAILLAFCIVTFAHADPGTFTLLGVGTQPVDVLSGPAQGVAAGTPGAPSLGPNVPVPPASDAVGPDAAGRPAFVTGFNQAWLHNAYGSQWTGGFDEAEVLRLLKATRRHGGRVLRMWLFEGLQFEGVIWDNDPVAPADKTRTVPTGLDPAKLAHLERTFELAEQEGVEIYITLFDGNMFLQKPDQNRKNEWWNVLNDKYGAGAGFLKNVLGPIVEAAQRHRRGVFAVDLMNEMNALVNADWFEGGWTGGVKFVSSWRASIRAVAAIPVTGSYGWGDSEKCLLARRLPESVVDFYDFHVYSDRGQIGHFEAIRKMARTSAKPIYLGEYGQFSPAFSDDLQSKVTENFLRVARRAGLAGAFAWRLSDVRPGYNAEARFSYEANRTWRPAAEVHRRVSEELAR